ncbi:hypothetical protein MMA231_02518 [Asticcacaulis sp. MM231]|uniref:hypothetical protein n=1 Tax=Asticcacaulis sp. MM231 TaxID=3157666 RepID=UPI0032D5805C
MNEKEKVEVEQIFDKHHADSLERFLTVIKDDGAGWALAEAGNDGSGNAFHDDQPDGSFMLMSGLQLDNWGGAYGCPRTEGETDIDYRNRLLSIIRK